MKTDTIDLTDPEDVAASRASAARIAAAQLAVRQAEARRDMLNATLSVDPAAASLATVGTAAQDTVRADDAVTAARNTRIAADAAVTAYQGPGGSLTAAQDDLNAATAAVSNALAQLMSEATTSTALTATVDGLALRQRFQSATATDPPRWDVATIPFLAPSGDLPLDRQLNLPATDEPAYAQLRRMLQQLDERVDAVADLVAAESVHHLVNGNPVRSGAALDIAATGAVPDDLEVIRSPRLGHDLTQRLLLLSPHDQQPAWTSDAPGVAAVADPALAAWASTVVPDPRNTRLLVDRVDPVTGDVGDALAMTADVLGLDPLAWLRIAADRGELSARVARVARDHWAGTLGEAARTGRVVVRDVDPRDPEHATMSDLLTAANAARAVLAKARALRPADLLPTAGDVPAPDDTAVAEASARVTAAEQRVVAVLAGLRSAAAPDATVDKVLDALFAASAVGVAEATPPLAEEVPALAALQAQAAVASTRLETRRAGAPFRPTPGDPQATLDDARARLTQLCGSRQHLLTSMASPTEARCRTDLGGGPVRIAGGEPAALRAWLRDHARIRPAAAALLAAYDMAESLACPGILDLRVTQLPIADPDHWTDDDPAPRVGVLSIVAARTYGGDLPGRLVGLALDAWVHTVPAATHATGLAFHYDEPNSTPPQVILIAVAPDVRPERQPGTWDLDTLLDTVIATLALAQERSQATDVAPPATLSLTATP